MNSSSSRSSQKLKKKGINKKSDNFNEDLMLLKSPTREHLSEHLNTDDSRAEQLLTTNETEFLPASKSSDEVVIKEQHHTETKHDANVIKTNEQTLNTIQLDDRRTSMRIEHENVDSQLHLAVLPEKIDEQNENDHDNSKSFVKEDSPSELQTVSVVGEKGEKVIQPKEVKQKQFTINLSEIEETVSKNIQHDYAESELGVSNLMPLGPSHHQETYSSIVTGVDKEYLYKSLSSSRKEFNFDYGGINRPSIDKEEKSDSESKLVESIPLDGDESKEAKSNIATSINLNADATPCVSNNTSAIHSLEKGREQITINNENTSSYVNQDKGALSGTVEKEKSPEKKSNEEEINLDSPDFRGNLKHNDIDKFSDGITLNGENKSQNQYDKNLFESGISSIACGTVKNEIPIENALELSFTSKGKKRSSKESESSSSFSSYLPWILLTAGGLITSFIVYKKFTNNSKGSLS